MVIRPGVLARAAFVLSALVMLATSIVVDSARADTKSKIEETRREIDSVIARLGEQRGAVDSLEAEASVLAGEINVVLSDIARAEDQIGRLHGEIKEAGRRMREVQAQLDARARQTYISGPGNTLELVLGASSFQDFNSRLDYVNRAVQADRELFDEAVNRRIDLRMKQEELERAERGLRAKRERLGSQQEALQQRLADAQRILDQLHADLAEGRQLLEQLEEKARHEEAARLDVAERAADEDTHEHGDGGSGGGGSGDGPFYVCPVDRPRAYSDDFGVPRPGGRSHQGNDIFAPHGTAIRAPFVGTAVDASNKTGGISVKVYGSRGFVYNAHMSGIGKLGQVGAGTVIGYVGNSGNAKGTPPHNHFEWHPGGGGAVNPYNYLNEVC